MATCRRTTVLVLCLIVSAEPLSLSLVPALPPAPAAPAAPGNPFLVTAPVAAPAAAPSISAAADLAPVAAIAPVSAPAPVAAPQSSPVAAPESSPGPALPTLPSSSISKTASYFKPIEDGYENIVYGFGHREEYDPTSEAKCKDKCLDYLDDLDCVMAIFCESENTQPSSVSAAAPSPGIGGLPMTIKTPQSQRSSKNYHCYLFTPSESKDQTTNYELSWGDNCKYMPVNPKCSLTVDDPGWKKYMGAIMSADHELIQKYDCNSGYTRTGKSLNEVKCTKDGVITKTGGCSLTNENSVSGGSPTPVVLSSLPQLPSVGSSSSLFAGIASRPTENGETDDNNPDTVVREEDVDTGTDVIDGNGGDTVVPEEGVDTGTDVIDGNGGDTVVPEEGVDTGTDVIDGNGGDTVVPEEGVDTGTDVTDGNGGDTVVPEEGVDTGTDVTDGNGGDTVVPEEGVDTGTDVTDGNGGDTVVPEEGVDTGTDVIDGNGGDTVVPEEGVDTGTDVTDGNGGDTVVPEEGVDTGTDVTDGNGGDTVVPEEGVDAEPVACDVNEVFIDGVCQCDMGYQSSSGICIDVDECQQHVCEQFEECTNTPGTFSCDCVEGFKQIENGACHPINCPGDFKYDSDGNVCFKVFMEPKSMESSKQTCQGFSGGRLAILNSKQKLDAVGGSLDFNGNIWLDAKESGQHTATVFDFQFYNWRRNSFEEITWGDGSRVSTELFTTQPTSEFKECTVMSTTNDNMLAEYSCGQTLPFVCEVPIKECPSTYVYDEESHFCFKFVPEKATQNIASEHCENEGSRLAITNTHAKIDSVKNEMLKASYHEGVYVGAEQLRSTEEQYEYTYYCWWYCWFPTVYTYTNYRIIEYNYWDDHSHIESSLFDVLEPNDDWFETCIEISAVLGHELNDISCYEYLAYACEIPQ